MLCGELYIWGIYVEKYSIDILVIVMHLIIGGHGLVVSGGAVAS
jgi:hypothetical protein